MMLPPTWSLKYLVEGILQHGIEAFQELTENGHASLLSPDYASLS